MILNVYKDTLTYSICGIGRFEFEINKSTRSSLQPDHFDNAGRTQHGAIPAIHGDPNLKRSSVISMIFHDDPRFFHVYEQVSNMLVIFKNMSYQVIWNSPFSKPKKRWHVSTSVKCWSRPRGKVLKGARPRSPFWPFDLPVDLPKTGRYKGSCLPTKSSSSRSK